MTFSTNLGEMLAAVLLLCAFLQISQLRLRGMVMLGRIGSVAVAGVAVGQGVAGRDSVFYGLALLIMVVQVLALPWLLMRKAKPPTLSGPLRRAVSTPLSLIIGLLPVGLAVLALSSIGQAQEAPHIGVAETGILVMALSVIVLGVWLVVIYRPRFAQMVGVMTLENGLILALLTMQGMGWVALIAVAALQMAGASLIWLGGLSPEVPVRLETGGASL